MVLQREKSPYNTGSPLGENSPVSTRGGGIPLATTTILAAFSAFGSASCSSFGEKEVPPAPGSLHDDPAAAAASNPVRSLNEPPENDARLS
ncbi:MAG: hypothetical protein RL417_271, partial [Pseudomonadota bacterium]